VLNEKYIFMSRLFGFDLTLSDGEAG